MRLHYKSYGSGEPLIILHGLFGTLDNWHSISRNLSEKFHVYAIDQRNHGRSPHTDFHTYTDLANDLRSFLDEHKINKTHLLGHSMGGSTVMQFAALYPERVNKMIVVDIAPKKYSPKHDEFFDAICSIDLKKYSTRKEIDTVLADKIPDYNVRQFILKNVLLTDSGTYKWKMNLKAIKRNYDHIIGGPKFTAPIKFPTLFIKGENSSYITDKDEELIKKKFRHAQIVTIKNAGHWLHAEATDEFVERVMDFLDT